MRTQLAQGALNIHPTRINIKFNHYNIPFKRKSFFIELNLLTRMNSKNLEYKSVRMIEIQKNLLEIPLQQGGAGGQSGPGYRPGYSMRFTTTRSQTMQSVTSGSRSSPPPSAGPTMTTVATSSGTSQTCPASQAPPPPPARIKHTSSNGEPAQQQSRSANQVLIRFSL